MIIFDFKNLIDLIGVGIKQIEIVKHDQSTNGRTKQGVELRSAQLIIVSYLCNVPVTRKSTRYVC